MDEFDKIREISEDLTNRREPTFSGFSKEKEPVTRETVLSKTIPAQEEAAPESDSSAEPYNFAQGFEDKIDFVQIDPIEEKSFSSMKLHLIAIMLFFLILILILAGFLIFNEDENDLDEIVTITASQNIVKEAPDQAGGINIPDQDKLVYNRIRSDNLLTKVESLFPEPEKPVLPQIIAIEKNAPAENFVKMEDVKPVNPLDESQSLSNDQKNVSSSIPVPENLASSISSSGKPLQEQAATSVLSLPENKVVPEVVKKEVIPLSNQAVKEDKPAMAGLPTQSKGMWRAQLFSSNNKNAVEKAWKRILAKNKDLLSNVSYEIVKADIPGKGSFYRLRVGQFQTRDKAESMCAQLRSRKQDCIPAK